MQFKKIFLALVLLFAGFSAVAQKTKIYDKDVALFRDALELYDKQHYSAAREKFEQAIRLINNPLDEVHIEAEYYAARCALELYNNDAEDKLVTFAQDHPDHPLAKTVFFQLGRHFYRAKRFKKALEWFEKVDKRDLSKEEQIEFNFKTGYSYFQQKNLEKAGPYFYEIKDESSEYQAPSSYYYGHISYTENKLQVALEEFRFIEKDPNFKQIAPYYIAQIFFKQKNYEALVEYAAPLIDSVTEKRRPEFARLTGGGYYRLGDYDKALPFLEIYAKGGGFSRDDNYELGYTYLRNGDYESAIKYLGRVSQKRDTLNQITSYHLGECYLKLNEKNFAWNAFREASEYNFDQSLREDALYNYAMLSFELSDAPYNDAIAAFETYLNEFPKSPRKDEVFQHLVKVYMTTRNYQKALDAIAKIPNKDIRIKEAHQTVSYNRAVELYHNRKYNEAIAVFKQVSAYPINKGLITESAYWIGESHYAQKEYTDAIYWYNKYKFEAGAILSNHFATADYNMGYCYYNQKAYKEAITAFRSFINQPNVADKAKLADASLRIGDCYYLEKNDTEALKHYQKGMEYGAGTDYALFQKAKTEGLTGKYEEKSATLEKLIRDFPKSQYMLSALYELAGTYRNQNKHEQAINTYERVIREYPQSLLVVKSLYNTAGIFYRTSQYTKAEEYFNRVVRDYPNAEERNFAVGEMKNVYEKLDKLGKYPDWLIASGVNYDKRELDSTLYDSGWSAYIAGDCPKAIKGFETYLEKIQHPLKEVSAQFYIAECKYVAGDSTGALRHYTFVTSKPGNPHMEQALVHAATISYARKDYRTALTHFGNLEKIASKQENIRYSIIGQMRCFYRSSVFQSAAGYAERTLTSSGVPESVQLEAMMVAGNSYMQTTEYDKAEPHFKQVIVKTKGISAAEARYRLAYILHLRGEYAKSEKAAAEVNKMKPAYDYWVAKSVILIGDNLVMQNDFFNARHVYNSVINGYKGDQEVIDEALRKLEKLNELEEAAKAPKEKTDMEIQFDGKPGEKDKKLFTEPTEE